MNFKEQTEKEYVESQEALFARDAKRREDEKQLRDYEEYESQCKQWTILQQQLHETNMGLEEARSILECHQNALASTQAKINALLAGGFLPPQPKPKPVQANRKPVMQAPKKAEPVACELDYVTPIYEPCPVCGQTVAAGIAYHKIPDTDLFCIVDPVRAKTAGLPAERIAAELERQKIALANKENS